MFEFIFKPTEKFDRRKPALKASVGSQKLTQSNAESESELLCFVFIAFCLLPSSTTLSTRKLSWRSWHLGGSFLIPT
jgi:hypothetical protein